MELVVDDAARRSPFLNTEPEGLPHVHAGRFDAFYCMLGISLLQYIRKQADSAWPGLTIEQLLEQLQQIQQYTLLYPPQGDKGLNRVATVLSKQTLVQQRLAQELGLDQLCSTPK
jgi:hypothetical protein